MTHPTGFGMYSDSCEDCARWPCVCEFACSGCGRVTYGAPVCEGCRALRREQAKALGSFARGVLR